MAQLESSDKQKIVINYFSTVKVVEMSEIKNNRKDEVGLRFCRSLFELLTNVFTLSGKKWATNLVSVRFRHYFIDFIWTVLVDLVEKKLENIKIVQIFPWKVNKCANQNLNQSSSIVQKLKLSQDFRNG